MSEIYSAVLGAFAITSIPLIAWLSRRATPEGRLTLRVQRLGHVYALMPESPERETFKVHLINAMSNLNEWLDLDWSKLRKKITFISVSAYIVGLIAAILIVRNADATAWVRPLVGVGMGLAITTVSVIAAVLLGKTERKRMTRTAHEADEAKAAARMEAVRLGRPLPAQMHIDSTIS